MFIGRGDGPPSTLYGDEYASKSFRVWSFVRKDRLIRFWTSGFGANLGAHSSQRTRRLFGEDDPSTPHNSTRPRKSGT